MFFGKKMGHNVRKVPFHMLFKGTAIIMVAPVMILFIFTLYEKLAIYDAILGVLAIFVISVIFVSPYIANLSALTSYVEKLAENKKEMPPDLSFLNNVEELQAAVERLQSSWEIRSNQLEGYLGENKILIDSLPNILILLDEKLGIIQTNNTAQSTFRKKGIQETLDFIISSEKISNTAKQVLEGKEGKTVEFRIPSPISRDYIVRIEKFPVFSPRGIALILVMHDITELKRTEKTFADFVANASHEIRTPLTSIVGFIETLRTSAKDDEEAKDNFLVLMEEQAERMSKLVTELLSLSRIERNMNTKPTDRLEIRGLVDNIIKQVEWEARNRGMLIKTKFEEGLPEVIGDKDEIEQVVYNLLSNAIKYGNRDTEVKLKVYVSDNDGENEIFNGVGKILKISVTDCGEGIAEEHLPRLTERFYRVDKARSREMGGTGLGLSIAKHILERHQGVLKIESKVGKGSTFTACLPVNRPIIP